MECPTMCFLHNENATKRKAIEEKRNHHKSLIRLTCVHLIFQQKPQKLKYAFKDAAQEMHSARSFGNNTIYCERTRTHTHEERSHEKKSFINGFCSAKKLKNTQMMVVVSCARHK